MEPLLPTLRQRKRYIAIEILSEFSIQRNALISAVSQTGCTLLGDVGYAKCGVSVLGFENNVGIIQCWHTSVAEAISILAFITSVDNQKVIIRAAGVSGTVKGAETKFLRSD